MRLTVSTEQVEIGAASGTVNSAASFKIRAIECDLARAQGPLTIYFAHMRDRALGWAGGRLL